MSDLYDKKCIPCSGDTPKLKEQEISNYLSKIDGWGVNDHQEMIFKKFKFKSYNKTLMFINNVAKIAEEEGHHPDISFGWGYSLIMIHTHAIKGLSVNDFVLASKIDKILKI